MKRWTFFSGLTVILVLLLVLGGYCVWVTRGLTQDLERMIAENYDTIRSVRGIRSGLTRINARYFTRSQAEIAAMDYGGLTIEKTTIYDHLAVIKQACVTRTELQDFARLESLLREYFSIYEKGVPDASWTNERFRSFLQAVAKETDEIGMQTERLAQINEQALLQRRDGAVRRGRLFGIAAIGIIGFSLIIYFYTSARLVQSVFEPLQRLRDSIQFLRTRRFDEFVPIKSGGELEEIALTFNQMAAELRAYLAESDQRVVEANRVCRALLEALPYPIYLVDDHYKVRMKNPRALALSRSLHISGEIPSAVRRCIDNAAATGTELVGDDLSRAVEVPLPGVGTGPVPTYLPQVFRMEGDPGTNGGGWGVLLIDVTKLRQFDRAKTKAIATLGHEVKTPVSSIRMTLHLLLEEKIGSLNGEQKELIAAGRDDCERLLNVLNSLLELARLEGGRVQMNLAPTTPGDLLSQTDAMQGGPLRGTRSPFLVEDTSPELPVVWADAVHVVRVLGNYLSNAAKYRTPGTPVTMTAVERNDGFVRFTVRNFTSKPLTEAEQARLFDPFYRRPGQDGEGSGLGLAICKEIATCHGGRVGVWAEGEIVEFYLDLRVAKGSLSLPPLPVNV